MTTNKRKSAASITNTYIEKLRKQLSEVDDSSQSRNLLNSRETSIPQEISELKERERIRANQLQNDDKQQDIELKKTTLNRLFWFLLIETLVVFSFALLQGTAWFGFTLEEWSFKLLVTVTLVQVTAMLFAAVRYLFPTKKS